jgi:hypothetical protein
MKNSLHNSAAVLAGALVAALLLSGCAEDPPPPVAKKKAASAPPVKQENPAPTARKHEDQPPIQVEEPRQEPAAEPVAVAGGAPASDEPPMVPSKLVFKEPPTQDGWKRSKPLGENIWLETKGDERRVLVGSVVCLREGNFGLECLLCKRGTKEHESILVTTADAKVIHAALEVAKMKAGSPVQYEPKFVAPSGDKVKVTLLFEKKGKWVSLPAQKMIRHAKTKKDLEFDWVFAGSRLYKNPDDSNGVPIYLANNDGAYISISNVMTAMLDLPVDSPKSLENRIYEPNTPNIPPLDTSVTIILEPAAKK